jgi:hypothetical protein
MPKLTARYATDTELREIMSALSSYYRVRAKPSLSKSARLNPQSGLYIRDLILEKRVYKAGKA